MALRTDKHDHIWMAHDDEMPLLGLMKGMQLSPKKAGTNAYAHITNATCLYTVKADNPLRTIYHMLGVDPYQHTVSNEHEVILQFVCRTSIRVPGDDRDINITVYDKAQAQYLWDYFDRDPRGYVSAKMVLHDLGFASVKRSSTPGRKRLTGQALEDKEAEDKIKDAARKKAERKAAKEAAK